MRQPRTCAVDRPARHRGSRTDRLVRTTIRVEGRAVRPLRLATLGMQCGHATLRGALVLSDQPRLPSDSATAVPPKAAAATVAQSTATRPARLIVGPTRTQHRLPRHRQSLAGLGVYVSCTTGCAGRLTPMVAGAARPRACLGCCALRMRAARLVLCVGYARLLRVRLLDRLCHLSPRVMVPTAPGAVCCRFHRASHSRVPVCRHGLPWVCCMSCECCIVHVYVAR
jgi:hypothetical protein